MQEKFSTVCKYVLFWLCAFTVKFAFSYRYQVRISVSFGVNYSRANRSR